MSTDDLPIDFRQLLAMLRRRLHLILTMVSICGIVLVGVILSQTPTYSAATLLLVEPHRKDLFADTPSISSAADSAWIDSEVEILRSDNVLLQVIESEDLLSDPNLTAPSLSTRALTFLRLAEPPPSQDRALSYALARLRSTLTVQRRGLTYLLSVQAKSADPDQAARIANAVARTYVQGQLAAKVESTLSARDLLQAHIAEARGSMIAADQAFSGWIDRYTAELSATPESPAFELRHQIEQLRTTRDNNVRLAAAVQSDIIENDWAAAAAALRSAELEGLYSRREQLRQRLAEAPADIDLGVDITALDAQLRVTAMAEADRLQQSIAQAEEQLDALRQQLRTSVLSSDLSRATLSELYGLQQNAQLARDQYDSLLTRVQEVQTRANLQIADSRIVSPALPPLAPSSPSRVLVLAVGMLGVATAAIVAALFYDSFVGGFTSEAQLGSVLRTSVSGSVPRQRRRDTSLADLVLTAPLSAFAESIRRLRATLDLSIRGRPKAEGASGGKVIMVSSTCPGEGKTTIALALARSYALSGFNTLLIDCDLRNPNVHRHLGIESSRGLLEFLAASKPDRLGTIVKSDEKSPTTFILGARRSELPTDQLLAGPAFARLMTAAKESFDVVVLDTPPVSAVVDAIYIAPFADGILLVTRWASTAQADVKSALNTLLRSKAPHTELVSVLNHEDQPRSAHRRKYGDYYATP